jgi:hypothetical protein
MKVFTYSQARQRFAEVLDTARREEVRIKRRTGDCFTIQYKRESESPFDIPSVKTKASTQDILDAVAESRAS